MTIYNRNMEALKKNHIELYEKIAKIKNEILQGVDTIYSKLYIGDALDGEKFIAFVDGEKVIPFMSTYSPEHEAERYVLQYKKVWEEEFLLLFGVGNVLTLKKILDEKCPIEKCIVYEPSIDIFIKIIEEYDMEAIFMNPHLLIMVEGVNGEDLEEILYGTLDYKNWKYAYFTTFSAYEKLFPEKEWKVKKLYERLCEDKKAELNTLCHFAESGMENEIRAFYWMFESKTIDDFVKIFPQNMPCIVVAAGPSLEKNVDILKQAKGKALIICVDTALNFLIKRGIIPDMTCTIDPQKGTTYFTRPELKEIPIAVSSDSDYRSLMAIGNIEPIYFSTTNGFFQKLYKERGKNIEYFDGGGSVGTVCFHLGVRLGFKTIILIGQDLAFTNRKAHAGMGKATEKDLAYNMLMVDGYYGDKVLTRADFKHYIDWYNMRIPQLEDIHVINATEGGAKLNGAEQMSLQEAIDCYCADTYDMQSLINQVPKVWESEEDKKLLYGEIADKYKWFLNFRKKLVHGIDITKRAIYLLKRGNVDTKELHNIDKELDEITDIVSTEDAMVILVKRMIDIDVQINDDLLEVEADIVLESQRLYQKMQIYLKNLLKALDEMLPIWKETLDKINMKYHFEK